MKSFYINPATGDLEFDSKKDLKMVEGDNEIVQCMDITLKTNQGEWMFNLDHGFNRSVVQNRHFNDTEVHDEIVEAVLQDDRIESVTEINFNYDKANRQLKVDFKTVKQTGETLEGVI